MRAAWIWPSGRESIARLREQVQLIFGISLVSRLVCLDGVVSNCGQIDDDFVFPRQHYIVRQLWSKNHRLLVLILFAIVVENDIRNVDSRKTPIETDPGITPPFERRKQIDADHNEYASDDQYGA